MSLYESCKTPIRVSCVGFILVGIGFLIQNESVNVFYTFHSSIILFLAELFLRIGELIIMNLPIIFMLNIVCKRANNASPVVMALVGYFAFSVTTMMFATQSLNPLAYSTGMGINSVFNISSGSRLPLETGLIGSILVAYITRVSFILSRHRGNLSLTNILSIDTAGIVYNFFFCFIMGIVVSYLYPLLFNYLQNGITFISEDLLDPYRIGLYSVIDRILSIFCLNNLIRQPFWYTSLGGSFSNTVTGQSVLGDVNIWTYLKNSNATYFGVGRFITPYYVINMFIIPAFYLGTLLSMSDKKERHSHIFMMIMAMIISINMGNPLPAEFVMLFTSPFLLLIYLILVGLVSGTLVNFEAFLGFSTNISNTVIAMPGNFADFIINIRNAALLSSIRTILIVGAVSFIVMFLSVIIYYRFFAFNFANSADDKQLIDNFIMASGGVSNIEKAGSGLFSLNISIFDPEKISIEKIQEIGIRKVVETRNGLSFELGTSSYGVAKAINKKIGKN